MSTPPQRKRLSGRTTRQRPSRPSGGNEGTRERRVAPVARADCPFAESAEFFGQRWTLLILRELFYGVDRFDDIQADLGISRSTLAERLARLEDRGLIARRSYQDAGRRRRARYTLTESGREFTTVLWAMTEWSERHLLGRPAPARMVQASTDRPVTIRFANDEGALVDANDLAWRIDHG